MPDEWLIEITSLTPEVLSVRLLDSLIVDPRAPGRVHSLLDIRANLKRLIEIVLTADDLDLPLATKALSELRFQLVKYILEVYRFDTRHLDLNNLADINVKSMQEMIHRLLTALATELATNMAMKFPQYPLPGPVGMLKTPPQKEIYQQILTARIRDGIFRDKQLLEALINQVLENYEFSSGETEVNLPLLEDILLLKVSKDAMLGIAGEQNAQLKGWRIPREASPTGRHMTKHARAALTPTERELGSIVHTMHYMSMLAEGLDWLSLSPEED